MTALSTPPGGPLVPAPVHDYLVAHGVREPAPARALRLATAALPEAYYQISPDQGQLLTFLIELLGARQVLEVGTFTGYAALVMALALPADGRVVTCDQEPRWPELGRPFWHAAGVAGRIELQLGPASATLARLIAEGAVGRFDLALIDADKEGYPDYYQQALALVRRGGVIAIDNTLWRGRVLDETDQRPRTAAIRRLNQLIRDDPRVTPCLLPLGDGFTLVRRR